MANHNRKHIIFTWLILTALFSSALGQVVPNQVERRAVKRTKSKAANQPPNNVIQRPVTPAADHHTHLWSLSLSQLIVEPLMLVIELPSDLNQLLKDKERFGGKNKDFSALTDLYTKDLLVLNPVGPTWLRGERALSFVTENTEIFRLLPTAFNVEGSSGYIAGYEAAGEGEAIRYLDNFLYVIKKGSDGKWRISSEVFTLTPQPAPKAISADELIREMDAAGIKQAAVLSAAYIFGDPTLKVENEYAKVRAENDWVANQTARFPNRLFSFCSFNPLRDYALKELDRCIENSNFKGLKLHVGNSRLDVLNREHIEKLRTVFRAANAKRFPIVIHLWVSGEYGPGHAGAFLNEVLPAAPDIPIQIAHMAATGPGYSSDDVFEVYANAAAKKDPRMKNVYIDVASDVISTTPPETLALVAKRLRQFGMQRILFASDRSPGFGNEAPQTAWESFRRLPLTESEFRTIANNVAPYMP